MKFDKATIQKMEVRYHAGTLPEKYMKEFLTQWLGAYHAPQNMAGANKPWRPLNAGSKTSATFVRG